MEADSNGICTDCLITGDSHNPQRRRGVVGALATVTYDAGDVAGLADCLDALLPLDGDPVSGNLTLA